MRCGSNQPSAIPRDVLSLINVSTFCQFGISLLNRKPKFFLDQRLNAWRWIGNACRECLLRNFYKSGDRRTMSFSKRAVDHDRVTVWIEASVLPSQKEMGTAPPATSPSCGQQPLHSLQSTRLSIRGVGGVDPVAQQRPQQRPHRRSLRSPELHRRLEPEYH